MISLILASAMAFQSPATLPNGLTINYKSHKIGTGIYKAKKKTQTKQQAYINKKYSEQMISIAANNMNGYGEFRDLSQETIHIGTTSFQSVLGNSELDVILDMKHQYNKALE
jgi:hypothetical protein